MSTSLQQPSREPSVAETEGGRVIQTIQGAYYVVAGGCTAFALQFPPSPDTGSRPAYVWLIQAIGLAVAVFGVALFRSGQRKDGPTITAALSMCVAVVLLVLSAASIAVGILPPLFLLDAGLEFMFACWWGAATLFFYWTAANSEPS